MPRCDLFGCVTTDAVQNGTVASDIIPLERESRIVCQEGFQLEGMVAAVLTCNSLLMVFYFIYYVEFCSNLVKMLNL